MFVYIIVIKNAITCSSSEMTFLFHFEDNSQTCFNGSPPTTHLLLAVTIKTLPELLQKFFFFTFFITKNGTSPSWY